MKFDLSKEEYEQLQRIREEYGKKQRAANGDRDKITALVIEKNQAVQDFIESCRKKQFTELAEGGKQAIIADLKGSIPEKIETLFNDFFMPGSDMGMLLGAGIATKKKNGLVLNSSFVLDALLKEYDLHIEFLKGDESNIQKAYMLIITGIKNSKFTDDADIKLTGSTEPKIMAPVPNGEALNYFFKVLNAKTIESLTPTGRNRHEKISLEENKKKDAIRITRQNNQKHAELQIEVKQAKEILFKTNKGFGKMLLFSLQKMTEQHFPLTVEIPLQELVDLGAYSSVDNAFIAFKKFFKQQKEYIFSGTVKKGKKTITEEGGILFYHYKRKNNIVSLSANENFNYEFIADYFTDFPQFAYALNNTAFFLVQYIFSLARQNTRSIKEKGSFNISFEAIRDRLGLPTLESTQRHTQLIFKPIWEAIEEIEDTMNKLPDEQRGMFTMTPIVEDINSVKSFLQGYLEIQLDENFSQHFVDLATIQEKQIEKYKTALANQQAKAALKDATTLK